MIYLSYFYVYIIQVITCLYCNKSPKKKSSLSEYSGLSQVAVEDTPVDIDNNRCLSGPCSRLLVFDHRTKCIARTSEDIEWT